MSVLTLQSTVCFGALKSRMAKDAVHLTILALRKLFGPSAKATGAGAPSEIP